MKGESRLIFEQLCDFIGRFATQILFALVISVAVTSVFLMAQWNPSDSFATGLITVNSFLIAAVGLLANFVLQGTRFLQLVRRTEEALWEAERKQDRLNFALLGQIHSWNITFLIFIPAIATFPFFISVILALGALVTSGGIRSVLTSLAFFLMLWSFLSILFSLWKTTIFVRRTIKSPLNEP